MHHGSDLCHTGLFRSRYIFICFSEVHKYSHSSQANSQLKVTFRLYYLCKKSQKIQKSEFKLFIVSPDLPFSPSLLPDTLTSTHLISGNRVKFLYQPIHKLILYFYLRSGGMNLSYSSFQNGQFRVGEKQNNFKKPLARCHQPSVSEDSNNFGSKIFVGWGVASALNNQIPSPVPKNIVQQLFYQT